jgi:hypothetical protein
LQVHNELEKILLSDEVSYNKTSIYNPQSNIYFHFFFRTLHFDDHSTRIKRRESDKFCHIRNIFEEIVKKFQENYTPGENVTLDEQLIPFRGRFSFKQYIPSKPARYGVKTFALVDSKSFYTINLETYCVKHNQMDHIKFQIRQKMLFFVSPDQFSEVAEI